MQKRQNSFTVILLIILLLVLLASICLGAVSISISEISSSLEKTFFTGGELTLNERIFLEIRLPRTILSVLTGAVLALGGALLQGLFRNPIIEPGLIGTSSGAAFGAALYFVLGASFQWNMGEWTLPFAASAGALLSTLMVMGLAASKEKAAASVTALLLTGIAVNALFLSGVGFMAFIARDPQARSITFWNLGTLSGANWKAVFITASVSLGCMAASLRHGKRLNALMLGETEAAYLGVDVKKIRRQLLLVNVIMVATCTAFVGVIAFVGLIVPQLLRMLNGSDNRFILKNSILMGAIVLTGSDLVARLLLRPAELPIGIVTSVVGVPVFLYLLRKKNSFV